MKPLAIAPKSTPARPSGLPWYDPSLNAFLTLYGLRVAPRSEHAANMVLAACKR